MGHFKFQPNCISVTKVMGKIRILMFVAVFNSLWRIGKVAKEYNSFLVVCSKFYTYKVSKCLGYIWLV